MFPGFLLSRRASLRVRFVFSVLVIALSAAMAQAQTFTKITDPTNPVVTDLSTQYQGAAWIDYNNDGHLDLFVANSFLYEGDGSGGFTSIATTIGSGIPAATGQGTCWADYDNDGDLDVFIASALSVLYVNDGSGTFSAVTTGDIGQTNTNRGWSCAWADWNGDQHLDLAITHPAGFVGPPTTNHLFRSSGPPTYELIRDDTTPITTSGLTSYTVGSWSDHDGDGDMDYFIGAGPADGTTQADFLFRNLLADNGSATFERITGAPLGTDLQDGQLWNWIDFDNDGDLDAYLTNWGQPLGGLVNRLYQNDDNAFSSIATGTIVTDVQASLGSIWGDFDLDGDLDVLVTNDNTNEDKYYSNDGDGTFTFVDNALTETLPHRGGSAGDYDGDGDLDIYMDGPFGARSLFRNDNSNGNSWLAVNLTGVDSNRTAIGAKVWAEATIGGQSVRQVREVSSQNTFNGHNSFDPHFGLGDATTAELTIQWPSGIVQHRGSVAADQTVSVTEITATPSVPDGASIAGTAMQASRVGADVAVTWDTSSCGSASAVNIYHGALGTFDSFGGAACSLPPTGSATVTVPDDSWFLVANVDGDADGSYGRDGDGSERGIDGAGTVCAGIVQHVTNPTCP